MIKINNNIVVLVDDKYFNTLEKKIKDIKNENKKKFKNVTNLILHLQKKYGIEKNVNYILDDNIAKKEEEVDKNDKEEEENQTKKIVFNKKSLTGGGWGSASASSDDEDADEDAKEDNMIGGSWGEKPDKQSGGQWKTMLP